MDRRSLLKSALAVAMAAVVSDRAALAASLREPLSAIEKRSGGRLGVCVRDTAVDSAAGYRDDERFALCSTFKLPLVALVLRDIDRGSIALDRRVPFGPSDMVPYAPVCERHLERGYMTVAELAEAAQTVSDNVAANLLLGLMGGPEGFTAKLRGLGDDVTRLDRFEPALNLVPAGEVRDTTTPAAMAGLVDTLVLGSGMSETSQHQLRRWLKATTTGKRRLKAGFPADWIVGNKTGTGVAPGMANKVNDVAVAWRPADEGALIIAAYFEADGEYSGIRAEDEAVLRQVAEAAANSL